MAERIQSITIHNCVEINRSGSLRQYECQTLAGRKTVVTTHHSAGRDPVIDAVDLNFSQSSTRRYCTASGFKAVKGWRNLEEIVKDCVPGKSIEATFKKGEWSRFQKLQQNLHELLTSTYRKAKEGNPPVYAEMSNDSIIFIQGEGVHRKILFEFNNRTYDHAVVIKFPDGQRIGIPSEETQGNEALQKIVSLIKAGGPIKLIEFSK